MKLLVFISRVAMAVSRYRTLALSTGKLILAAVAAFMLFGGGYVTGYWHGFDDGKDRYERGLQKSIEALPIPPRVRK